MGGHKIPTEVFVLFFGFCTAFGFALAAFALGTQFAYYHVIRLETIGLILLPVAPLAGIDLLALRSKPWSGFAVPRRVIAILLAGGFAAGLYAVTVLTLEALAIVEFLFAFPTAAAIIASAAGPSTMKSIRRTMLLGLIGMFVMLIPAVLYLSLLLEPGCVYGRCVSVASSGAALFALLFSFAMLGALAGSLQTRTDARSRV